MEIKIVKKPMQDENTLPEDIQYPNESWCVKTSFYMEGDGGMNLWFEEIDRVKLEKNKKRRLFLYKRFS
jgi:hypothetical protein